ncbi:hypothetical protein [Micromonospora cathayae]|uniref:Glycosyl hydrolase family 98 putative carbohydrate-binding module domain-containing protein n=1 Tax=Micromonospora cathayae TaxID=3028804 RepID=A0ABY7ZYL1_9ACTN|nr:hypothetical protein [Micromonospora sp. HUAS 3]WDZ87098.1 hypothetical protein PVK37_12160 [Micromonospora sp. HUAS 3]
MRVGSDESGPSPAYRPTGRTRVALRRLARTRQRRRWAVAALAVVAGLVVSVPWLAARRTVPDGPDPAGPPGAARSWPSAPAALPTGADLGAALPSPGLQPRRRWPTPPPAPPTPSRTPTPAVPPLLDVRHADAPAVVDLSAVGGRDWVHWGLRGGDSVVRKRDGSGEIVDRGGSGGRGGHDTNPELFRWRDGTPVRSIAGTSTGVYACGAGNGFALAVAGNGEVRTVRLYAGLWMARGRLEARLSTGGPVTTVRLEDPHTNRTAEFTVRFRAPPGAKLLVDWRVEHAFDRHCGNVDLQAVALH